MKKLILISTLVVLSNCDFERDLADCTNAGRCTNGAGGGIGFIGGGTGSTGGGMGITGGGSGLNTDCQILNSLAFKPVRYNYYSYMGYESTESQYTTDSGATLLADIRWHDYGADAGTNVNGNTTSELLDGGIDPNRTILLGTNSSNYQLRSGRLTLKTSRSNYGAMSGEIYDGYFYNLSDEEDCISIPHIAFDSNQSVTCEPITPGCFVSSGYAAFFSSNGQDSTYGSATCDNKLLYVQVNWSVGGTELGVSPPTTYDFFEPSVPAPLLAQIQRHESDGGESFFYAESGTIELIDATRDAGGVFNASLSNMRFYIRNSGIRVECLSLDSQIYDFNY